MDKLLAEQELIEKCRLTENERIGVYYEYMKEQSDGIEPECEAHYLKMMQYKLLHKAIPIISAEARKQAEKKALKAMEIYDSVLTPNPYTTLVQALKEGEQGEG